MFPLSAYTMDVLVVIAIGACMTLARAVLGSVGWQRVAIILIVGLLWPWPIAVMKGLHHYTLAEAYFLSGWTVAALVVGLALGAIARRPPYWPELWRFFAGWLAQRTRWSDSGCPTLRVPHRSTFASQA